MRILVGLLVLLLLFASAAAWQGRLTRDLRRRHDHQRGNPILASSSGQTLQAGWNTLIVGRPSGADPFFSGKRGERRRRLPQADAVPEVEFPAPEPPPLPRYGPDFELTVRPGDVLSKLCQGHYRTRPEGLSLVDIVDAVGRYNGLSSPDALRAGARLRLPDVDRFANVQSSN